MPEHILLINRRHRRGPPKAVVPPQLRKYLFRKRRPRTITVRSHAENRRRKPRRHHGYVAVRRAHHPRPYHYRNPRLSFKSMTSGVGGDLTAAVIGAVGAIAIEWGWSKVSTKLPATFQTGWGAVAAEAALAIGVGIGLDKALPKQRRMIAAGVVGSLVVISYSALKPLIAAKLGLSGLQDYRLYPSRGMPGMGRVGAYIPGATVALPAPAGMSGGVGAYIPGNAIQNPAAALRGVMGGGVGGIAPSY